MSRTCRICRRERPNEAFNLRGHRIRICKRCLRLKRDLPPSIESLDEIAHFLIQSNISAKNVVRLETLVQSTDAEVRDWTTAVLDVARRFPRKRRRYVRMTRESPDLLRRLRDLLGDEWWDDLLAHGVLVEVGDVPGDGLFLDHGEDTRPPERREPSNPADARPSERGLKRVTVHTDGACQHNPGPGGWAAILRYGDRTKELKGSAAFTTNNRMELQAAIGALAALKYRCEVEIVTDSKYLRDGVTRWVARWKANGWKTVDRAPVKNRDLWEQLDEQCARHQVTWCWIKGHAGHPDNERCDALARAEISRLHRRGGPPRSPAAAASASASL